VRNSWKKLGDLLPDAYANAGAAVDIDFDPTGRFGRYMDRRLKRLVKHHRRLWPTPQLGVAERTEMDVPSCQDTNQAE
jgi:hypothetical protein